MFFTGVGKNCRTAGSYRQLRKLFYFWTIILLNCDVRKQIFKQVYAYATFAFYFCFNDFIILICLIQIF